jgi:hypothetical protein
VFVANLISWIGRYRQPASFVANVGYEPCRDRNFVLRFELSAFLELMGQMLSTNFFVTRAHHYRAAVIAAVFADKLISVQATNIVMRAVSHLHDGNRSSSDGKSNERTLLAATATAAVTSFSAP